MIDYTTGIKNMVSLQSIYDAVIAHYGWNDYADAKKRLLRKKYAFLQKHLVLCDGKAFKVKGGNYVPANDAPIVRDLLIEAVDDTGDNEIYAWFNGNIDTSDSKRAVDLFECLKKVILNPYSRNETDLVTSNDWLRTVSASINHNTAQNTLDLMQSLERFRNDSLALDMNIAVGELTISDENGSREYILEGKKNAPDISGKTIEKILEGIQTQDDYFSVLAQILKRFECHARGRIKKQIENYAEIKSTFGFNKADDPIPRDSIASDYTIWFQRIHEYLTKNPDICREIENKAGIEKLAEFFRMEDR